MEAPIRRSCGYCFSIAVIPITDPLSPAVRDLPSLGGGGMRNGCAGSDTAVSLIGLVDAVILGRLKSRASIFIRIRIYFVLNVDGRGGLKARRR